MNLREKGKQHRKQQILQATATLLDQEGPEGLSVAKIAEQAEVSVATLYNLIGSLDKILDLLVQSLEDTFTARLNDDSKNVTGPLYFGHFIDATHEALSSNPGILQSSLRSVFQLSIQRGNSKAALATAEKNRQLFIQSLDKSREQGLLKESLNSSLMAEQLMMANTILLENWAAGLLSLDRYQWMAKHHFTMLLRAWATRKWAQKLDQQLLDYQDAIEALPLSH